MKDRPKIPDGVLHRRSGQNKPMPANECHRSLRVLGIRIFDMRCLVENDRRKFETPKPIDIPAQERIAGEDKIAFRNSTEEFAAVGALDAQDF